MIKNTVKKQGGEVFHIIGIAEHNIENIPVLRTFCSFKDGRIKLIKEEPYRGGVW
jgi:hypothetical protein